MCAALLLTLKSVMNKTDKVAAFLELPFYWRKAAGKEPKEIIAERVERCQECGTRWCASDLEEGLEAQCIAAQACLTGLLWPEGGPHFVWSRLWVEVHDQKSNLHFYLSVEGSPSHLQLKILLNALFGSQTLRVGATPGGPYGAQRNSQTHLKRQLHSSLSSESRLRRLVICEKEEGLYKWAEGGWQVSLPKWGGASRVKKYLHDLRQ